MGIAKLTASYLLLAGIIFQGNHLEERVRASFSLSLSHLAVFCAFVVVVVFALCHIHYSQFPVRSTTQEELLVRRNVTKERLLLHIVQEKTIVITFRLSRVRFSPFSLGPYHYGYKT